MINEDNALKAFGTRQADRRNGNRDALLVYHADGSQTNADANATTFTTNSRRRINTLRKFLSVQLIVLDNLNATLQINSNTRSATKLIK